MRSASGFYLLVFFSLGCSGSDPARQLQGAQSWMATSILLGERWLARSVPDDYAGSALENASDELRKAASAISSSMQDSTAEKRDSLVVPIRVASARALRMRREVLTKNAPAFRAQLDSLRAAGRLLEAAAPGPSR